MSFHAALLPAFQQQAGNYFANPIGLWAFLSLIPLIIIYLIRPRPKKQAFPSLSFLMKQQKDKALSAFLSRFFKDPLFLFQLLALLILSASIAYPYVMTEESEIATDVVVILDASASMQAQFGITKTRWDEAVSKAEDELAESNTLILAGNIPEVILEKGTAREAKKILAASIPKDTTTDIFSALILADDFLPDGGKAVVISDFLQTSSARDLGTAISVMEGRGVRVQLVPVRNDIANIGIVDISVGEEETELRVKNFGTSDVDAVLKAGATEHKFSLAPKASEIFTIGTPPARTVVELSPSDQFPLDNKAYISAPEKQRVSVLYITNDRDDYLYTALDLMEFVDLKVEEPPTVSLGNHDVYVLKNADSSVLLQTTLRDLEKKVDEGASLIISAQEGSDYSRFGISSGDLQKIPNTLVNAEGLTINEDIEFGTARAYFHGGDITPMAYLLVEDSRVPVIGTKRLGSGNVLFYGLEDGSSSFKTELMYPVFWKRVVQDFAGRQSVEDLNFRTGGVVDLGGRQEVDDPEGQGIETRVLQLEQSGFYGLQDSIIAANLANELESDISGSSGELDTALEEAEEVLVSRQVPRDLTPLLALLGLIAILLEMAFVKLRGDL